MINWNYDANDYSTNKTNLLDEGKYRVRIINAIETVAKNGTEGLEISLEVNGHSNKLRHYIWYNRENAARTNQLLGEFFNSFDISAGERSSCENWLGKTGAVYVMHDVYKGRQISKVAFCLNRDQQTSLPAWKETQLTRVDENDMAMPPKEPFVPRKFGDLCPF